MTRRLARAVILLYPLAFRRRYQEEMEALLDATPTTAATVFDLLRSAAVAHLRPQVALAGLVDADDRLRASTSGVLACWVVFAAVGLGFAKTTEDAVFTNAGDAHAVLGGAHVVVQAGAIVASLAVVGGALPLIPPALRAARRDPGVRALVALPTTAVVLFASFTGLLVWLASSAGAQHATPLAQVAFAVWGLLGLACAALCVVTARRVLFAVPSGRRRLVWAMGCGTVVVAAMASIALATALYTIALWLDASRLAASADGPLGATSTGVTLIFALTVMAITGALAGTSTRRGWRALRSSV